jgi:hypothetical protein
MRLIGSWIRRTLAVIAIAPSLLHGAGLTAQAASPADVAPSADTPVVPEFRLPDLRVLPPFDLELRYHAWNRAKFLRLAITFWNDGAGPLELRGVPHPPTRQMLVWQHLYAVDDTVHEHFAGEFVWHPGHEHWHFEDFAVYELWSLTPNGALDQVVASSGKVSFCIIETDAIDRERPDFSRRRRFAVCGPGLQGLSVGWGDTYAAHLSGQLIDISDVPNGTYALVVRVDPADLIRESDELNNASLVYLEIVTRRLYVFGEQRPVTKLPTACVGIC